MKVSFLIRGASVALCLLLPRVTWASVTVDRITPTVLFVRDQDLERQLIDVVVTRSDGDGGGDVQFNAEVDGATVVTTRRVATGTSSYRIAVPPAPGPAAASVTIRTNAGGQPFRAELAYQRRMQIHLAPGSHLDIGYNQTHADCIRHQAEFLDRVVELCEQTADYPAWVRYHWTMDGCWTMENYLRDRPPEQIERLAKFARLGQIEISASYVNNLHDLSSAEQLVRQIYPAARRIKDRLNVPVLLATNTDVTGVSWQYVQALARSGVKYLSLQPNQTRAPRPQRSPAMFWWEAPDGSRLLTWYGAPTPRNGSAYSEAYVGMFPEAGAIDFDASAKALTERVREIDASGYPSDSYLMLMLADNKPPPEKDLPDFVRHFGELYCWPKLMLSTPRKFLEAAEKRGARDLPVHRGDFTDWWADGSGSSANETALLRQTQDRMTSAEILGTLAAMARPSEIFGRERLQQHAAQRQAWLDEAFDQAVLYTEHTWGAKRPMAFDDPQWPAKRGFVETADRLSREALDSALGDLSSVIANPSPVQAVAVCNSLSWQRDGAVEAVVSVRQPQQFELTDGDDSPVPYEVTTRTGGTMSFRFVAKDVPALGYKLFLLKSTQAPTSRPTDPSLRADETGLENKYFRVQLDPVTGTIRSILDKARGRELIDQTSEYRANQYLDRRNTTENRRQAQPTTRQTESTPTRGAVRVVSAGPVSASVEVTKSAAGTRGIVERITLFGDMPQVNISNTVDKQRIDTPEEGYYAFPFAVQQPTITYEIPGAAVRFVEDQLPGSALDWQAVASYVDVSGASGGVTFSPLSAPLVEFDRIRTQEFLTRPGRYDQPESSLPRQLMPKTGSVFSYIFNNLWYTNYRPSQEGPTEFQYVITSHDGAFDPIRETRFGWGARTPLHAVAIPAGQQGCHPARTGSLLSVTGDGVLVQTAKQAFGRPGGIVLRLLEVTGKAQEATILFPMPIGMAFPTDPVERPQQQPLSFRANELKVALPGHGMITVVVSPGDEALPRVH